MFAQPIKPTLDFRYIKRYEPPYLIPPTKGSAVNKTVKLKAKPPITNNNLLSTPQTIKQDSINKAFLDLLTKFGDKIASLNTPVINNRDSIFINIDLFFSYKNEKSDGTTMMTKNKPIPVIDTALMKQYKKSKLIGWGMIGGGILLQGGAIYLLSTGIEPSTVTNNYKVTLSKISGRTVEDSHIKNNVTISAISGVMILGGGLIEYFGGLKIRDANIGLGSIKMTF